MGRVPKTQQLHGDKHGFASLIALTQQFSTPSLPLAFHAHSMHPFRTNSPPLWTRMVQTPSSVHQTPSSQQSACRARPLISSNLNVAEEAIYVRGHGPLTDFSRHIRIFGGRLASDGVHLRLVRSYPLIPVPKQSKSSDHYQPGQ